MANKPKFKVKDVEDALRASAGIVYAAARRLQAKYGSCSPTTVRNYMRRHKRLREVYDEVVDTNIDLAENELIKAITDGNLRAVTFYLETKGKARGYSRSTEIKGNQDFPLHVQGGVKVYIPDNGRDRK